jgi:hypothetical protein
MALHDLFCDFLRLHQCFSLKAACMCADAGSKKKVFSTRYYATPAPVASDTPGRHLRAPRTLLAIYATLASVFLPF